MKIKSTKSNLWDNQILFDFETYELKNSIV